MVRDVHLKHSCATSISAVVFRNKSNDFEIIWAYKYIIKQNLPNYITHGFSKTKSMISITCVHCVQRMCYEADHVILECWPPFRTKHAVKSLCARLRLGTARIVLPLCVQPLAQATRVRIVAFFHRQAAMRRSVVGHFSQSALKVDDGDKRINA